MGTVQRVPMDDIFVIWTMSDEDEDGKQML
jgi:hypothetical protein